MRDILAKQIPHTKASSGMSLFCWPWSLRHWSNVLNDLHIYLHTHTHTHKTKKKKKTTFFLQKCQVITESAMISEPQCMRVKTVNKIWSSLVIITKKKAMYSLLRCNPTKYNFNPITHKSTDCQIYRCYSI